MAVNTIRDLLISPFEIDVAGHNFTVVRVTISKPGTVAGVHREGGKRVRSVVGSYITFGGAMSRIAEELLNVAHEDYDNQIITIKEFLAKSEAKRALLLKWCKMLLAPFTINNNDMPVITAKEYSKSSNVTPEDDED